jgi:DNA-binding NarL/FixJ family response regulator
MIVDSSPLTRLGLLSLIQCDRFMEVCAEAGEAPAARRLCTELRPDLIVLDLTMRRGDGLGLLRDFSRLHAPARALVMTEHEDALSMQRAFRAGARGYVSKHDEPSEVLAGLEALRRGMRFASRRVLHLLLGHLASGTMNAHAGTASTANGHADPSVLSGREMEVFELIGAGFGPSAIALELRISVKTVETHQQRIKEKLRLKTGAELKRHATRWATSQSMQQSRHTGRRVTIFEGNSLVDNAIGTSLVG